MKRKKLDWKGGEFFLPPERINLSDFPSFPKMGESVNQSEFIAVYLSRLMDLHDLSVSQSLSFPSLTDLAKFFGCTQMVVYDAFQSLRCEGYDYQLTGVEDPITFWKLGVGQRIQNLIKPS